MELIYRFQLNEYLYNIHNQIQYRSDMLMMWHDLKLYDDIT